MPTTPTSLNYGPLVIEYTPSDTEKQVFVRVTLGGVPVAANNLTPFNTTLSWKDASTNTGTTSGDVYVEFGTGTNVSSLNTHGINWKLESGDTNDLKSQQLAYWS